MTYRAPRCPKCDVQMEEGFLMDRGDHHAINPAHWVEGAPEPSFWRRTKTRGKDTYRVATYRCERCGFLESYATDSA